METIYSLAVINKPNISSVRELTVQDFEVYSAYLTQLENFRRDETLYKLVELNYQDLKIKYEYYLEQYSLNPQIRSEQFDLQFIDINRFILNLLSSIRTYLDHTETRLNRNFGKSSEEYKLFETLKSECFDSSFSYGFLYKLRNYSQHCGLPSGSIRYGDNQNGKYLKIILVRDNLLQDFDWGTVVRPQLEKQNQEFDIFPLFEEKILLLEKINKQINEIIIKRIKREGDELFKLILEAKNSKLGAPCLLKISGDLKDNPTIQIRYFPYDIISRVTGINIKVINKMEQ
jgi:hypothetical protein